MINFYQSLIKGKWAFLIFFGFLPVGHAENSYGATIASARQFGDCAVGSTPPPTQIILTCGLDEGQPRIVFNTVAEPGKNLFQYLL